MNSTHEGTSTPITLASTDATLGITTLQRIEQAHLALVLMAAAGSFADTPCGDDECDGCNAFKLAYWRLDSMLDSPTRRSYQATLRETGTPLPDAPWETID